MRHERIARFGLKQFAIWG